MELRRREAAQPLLDDLGLLAERPAHQLAARLGVVVEDLARDGHHPGPLREGEEDRIGVTIPEERDKGDQAAVLGIGTTFKITLVWSDPPGPLLQNDLDLIVIASDGTERHGNSGTSDTFDRENNVEQIVWTGMPAGDAEIIVRAARITQFPEPYAYAWRIS